MTTTRIELTQGLSAIIDLEDEHLTYPFKWYALKNKSTVYPVGFLPGNKTPIGLNRLVMGAQPGQFVAFVDGNGLNCTKANLRIGDDFTVVRLTHPAQMDKPRVKAKFRGISQARKSKRWRAKIVVEGKSIHLGTYDTPEEAAAAYDASARQHYGEYAVTNFTDGAPSQELA